MPSSYSDGPKVYLLLGPNDSGRRAFLLDLVLDAQYLGLGSVLYFKHTSENPHSYDSKLAKAPHLDQMYWSVMNCKVKHEKITRRADSVFFVAPSSVDPSDVIEALKGWLTKNNCQLTRIFTMVHCALINENPAVKLWYEACMHFSDIVLLNRRTGLNPKWLGDFTKKYAKQFNPTRFILVKKDKVDNPADVLDGRSYRNSLYFDTLIPIEEDDFEDSLPTDVMPDIYLERLENGKRSKPIPTFDN